MLALFIHLHSIKFIGRQLVDSPDKPHLLGHEAEFFSRQEVEVKDEPPVKVAISVQRPVVDISLLLVLLHAWHPAGKANSRCEHSLSCPNKFTVTFYYTVWLLKN